MQNQQVAVGDECLSLPNETEIINESTSDLDACSELITTSSEQILIVSSSSTTEMIIDNEQPSSSESVLELSEIESRSPEHMSPSEEIPVINSSSPKDNEMITNSEHLSSENLFELLEIEREEIPSAILYDVDSNSSEISEDEIEIEHSTKRKSSSTFNKKTPLSELQRHHNWLYYDAINEGYKCKVCELFPEAIVGSRGQNKDKFSDEAVKDLTDHPKRCLTRHEQSQKHLYAVNQYEDFKSRHTIESIEKRREANEIHESGVTELALEKLMKITVFMVKKHWAHVSNYNDFVKFIGNDLKDLVLHEYLKLCGDRKNATYLSEFTVMKFLKLIGEYMENETLNKVREAEHFTVMLDESTDEANRSELAIIVRLLSSEGSVENHFLTLISLSRCDAVSIFTAVYDYLKSKNIDMTRVRFSGMDGCSTMLGEHQGVTVHFKNKCSHHSSIHCRNHRLALCFSHLIPFHKEFESFDGLLLNTYLMLKHSTVKTSIFEEVQQSYGLKSLKLVKAAVTRWLSHGKAAQRVLDRYPQLIDTLSQIYERKKEPAVQGILQQLTTPSTVATLCFLADVLDSTNSLQIFLQTAHLNFLDIPGVVDSLIEVLQSIRDDPCRQNSNFIKLESFLDVASKKERTHCTRSRSETFSKERYISNVVKPFISDLIQEIRTAFEIPDHLKGFMVFDPQKLPRSRDDIDAYGNDLIEMICKFYGECYEVSGEVHPKVVDRASLLSEFQVYKVFMFKERFEYESKQQNELEKYIRLKESSTRKLETMKDLLSTRETVAEKQRKKEFEGKIVTLKKTQKASFNVVYDRWVKSGYNTKHPSITKMLEYTALIPPSTAEVERVFSTMKLICTRLRKSLTTSNLGHCIRVSKFRELNKLDYEKIISKWLTAEDTKSKRRKISAYMKK